MGSTYIHMWAPVWGLMNAGRISAQYEHHELQQQFRSSLDA
jgi:hypothetical protein